MDIRTWKRIFRLSLIASFCFLLSACRAKNTESAASEPIPQLLYQRTVTLDQEAGIRHAALDCQGLPLNVYFEVPVLEEESEGSQKINDFFQNLEDDFFSEKNENLLSAWEFAASIPRETHESTDFSYENTAVIHIHSDQLLSVGIYYYWWMGGVNDTGGDCYTFSPETGELLKLSDLIEETEQEALHLLYDTMESEGLDLTWSDLQERPLDDFDFYIEDNHVFIVFDRYEAAAGAAGSITILLPVTLKDLGEL